MRHSKTFDQGVAVASMLKTATPPREMASAPVAPARGAKRLVSNYEMLPGGTRRYAGSHWEDADVFDKMCRDACARHPKVCSAAYDAFIKAGGIADKFKEPAFEAPFTPGQMSMARRYRDLTERHSAGGVKCASLEARGGGAGQGGEFIDAYIAEGRELAAIHRNIGVGEAMVVRRIRPSARGSKASIMDRQLVDMVCLGGADLSAVLRKHGWFVDGKHRAALRAALCSALDRMQGYGCGGRKKGA